MTVADSAWADALLAALLKHTRKCESTMHYRDSVYPRAIIAMVSWQTHDVSISHAFATPLVPLVLLTARINMILSQRLPHDSTSCSKRPIPYLIQIMLLDLVCPVMTCLMHDWAHFLRVFIFSVIENIPNALFHVCLEQHPLPPAGGPNALAPS